MLSPAPVPAATPLRRAARPRLEVRGYTLRQIETEGFGPFEIWRDRDDRLLGTVIWNPQSRRFCIRGLGRSARFATAREAALHLSALVGDARANIIRALRDAAAPLSADELAAAVRVGRPRVKDICDAMAQDEGTLVKLSNRKYRLP